MFDLKKVDGRNVCLLILLGLLLVGTFTATGLYVRAVRRLAVMEEFTDRVRLAGDDLEDQVLELTTPLTYFQLHYVGMSGAFVKIPRKFCLADHNFDAECGPEEKTFREFDLHEHQLPVERIQAAVTDMNEVVVYQTKSDRRTQDGCVLSDMFVYNPRTKETKKLRGDEGRQKCEAVGSVIASISPGGRYLRLSSFPTNKEGYISDRIYDIKNDDIDKDLETGHRLVFFSAEESNEDRFALYLSGCSVLPIYFSEGETTCYDQLTLMLRNNQTGEKVHLTEIENRLTQAGISLGAVQMFYSFPDNTLSLYGDELGQKIIIEDFGRFIPASWR